MPEHYSPRRIARCLVEARSLMLVEEVGPRTRRQETAYQLLLLALLDLADLTDRQMWLLCERYGIAFTPPTARDLHFAGIIKALEELVDAPGHHLKSAS